MKKFFKGLDFQGWLWLLSPLILVAFLALELSGWGDGPSKHELELEEQYDYGFQSGYDAGYEDGFDQGYYEGREDGEDMGQDEGYWDGYHEGSQYGWEDNIHEVADYFAGGAVDFAIEHGGMHPEDAASIIENGGTKSEYEAAARTLYYYFMYFFNCEYS